MRGKRGTPSVTLQFRVVEDDLGGNECSSMR